MASHLWLPKGFVLSDGSTIKSLLYEGYGWQILSTNGSVNILLMRTELAQKWIELDFIDTSLFKDVSFGAEVFRSLSSNKRYALTPVENGESPENKVDALAFAIALKESRKYSEDISFHDAIYVEQYSRLLPCQASNSCVEDDIVLGTWLSGGVGVSAKSFRRLADLVGWMTATDLAEIIKAAGFATPKDVNLLDKYQSSSQINIATKNNISTSNEIELLRVVENNKFKLEGRIEVESFFNDHVIDIIFNSEKYQLLGINFPSAIILHGPPGCGKTFAVERLVEFIGWPCYLINSSNVGSPYIHETSKKISDLFDKAIDTAPSIIVIDEMESFLSDRRSGNSSGLYHVEEVAEFLRRIPEAIKNKVLIIAMTNMLDVIDPAILRRGRFDHIIEVSMPRREDVVSLINALLSKLPKADDLNLDKAVDVLTGKALSDTDFVIREAARLAAQSNKTELDQKSLDLALSRLPKEQEERSTQIGFIHTN